MQNQSEIEFLGAFVHGVLAGFHGLGVAYNLRRRNWKDVAIHALFLVYDAEAAHRHWRASR